MKSRILALTTCLLIIASTSAIVCAGDNAGGVRTEENFGFVISPGESVEGFSTLDATLGQGDYDIVWFIVLGAGNLNLQVEDLYIMGDVMIATGNLLIGGPASFTDWAISPDYISIDVSCPDFALGFLIMCYYDAPGGFPAAYTWRASLVGGGCDIVGTWEKRFDWGCDGTIEGTVLNYLYADGTFTSSGGSTGTWTLDGDQFNQYFDSGAHYWGTVSPNCTYISGEMVGVDPPALTGCWDADKIALPSTPPASQGGDSLDEDGN